MKNLASIIDINKKPAIGFLIILFAASLIYANILNAPFHFDDHELMLGNPAVRNLRHLMYSWGSLSRKFFTFLTFAINYHFGKDNPFGYHLVNVLLHIGTAFLVYYVLRLLFLTPVLSKIPLSKHKNQFSLFVSLVFLCHPIQTQAVTYIWQRSEILSGFFYLLTYLFYLKARLNKRNAYYIASLFAFFLGLFTKGTIVTVPIIILLTECSFFIPEKSKKIFSDNWPFICVIITALMFFWRFLVTKSMFLLEKLGISFLGVTSVNIEYHYCITQLKVIMRYIQLCFIPINQNFDYYFPLSQSFLEKPVILSFSALVAILAFPLKIFKKHRLMSFGIFLFFIYLLPTSLIGLRDPIWEHRLYISIVGFGIFLGSVIFTFVSNKEIRKIILIVIIVILSGLTVKRNILWRSPEKILEDTIKKSPKHFRPHHTLGTLYYTQGRINEAVEMFKRTIKLNPRHAEPYNNLGLIYMNRGYINIASQYFHKAISLRRDFVTPYINLAHIDFALGNYGRARSYLEQSLVFRKTSKAYLGLANVYIKKQDLDLAEKYFKKVLSLDPYNKEAVAGLDSILKE